MVSAALVAAAILLSSTALARPSWGSSDAQAAFNLPWRTSPRYVPPKEALRVPVQLGVMSRCPDAHLCERTWDRVLDDVGPLVDMELLYIATLNSTAKYGVTCMHGELECTGNIQQLCARKYFEADPDKDLPSGSSSWRDWWDFVQCQNYGPTSRIGDTAVAKECASVVKHDWHAGAYDCVHSKEGERLLKESINVSKELGITKSCTILVNGRAVCIHDGTWKSCDGGHEPGDFARQVRDEWKRINAGKVDSEHWPADW